MQLHFHILKFFYFGAQKQGKLKYAGRQAYVCLLVSKLASGFCRVLSRAFCKKQIPGKNKVRTCCYKSSAVSFVKSLLL